MKMRIDLRITRDSHKPALRFARRHRHEGSHDRQVLHNGFDLERPLTRNRCGASGGSVVAFCDQKPNSISNEDSRGAP